MAVYSRLLTYWVKAALGRSYYHVPQPIGRHYRPDRIEGYFNDMSRKTRWQGESDGAGIPMDAFGENHHYYFPTTIFQKGLGHWDSFLAQTGPRGMDRAAFLAASDWAVEHEDARGGWKWPPPMTSNLLVPYSAMSQGEGASLLTRAYHLTKETKYIEAARRAVDLMLEPIDSGGTARALSEGLLLEEYPRSATDGALNGWIFALFGLHDLLLVDPDDRLQNALDSTTSTLANKLDEYDAGFWSYYDSTRSILSSPFYHGLHISQLTVLESTFPAHSNTFALHKNKFQRYQSSPICRTRAIAIKIAQKLRRPPETVFR